MRADDLTDGDMVASILEEVYASNLHDITKVQLRTILWSWFNSRDLVPAAKRALEATEGPCLCMEATGGECPYCDSLTALSEAVASATEAP